MENTKLISTIDVELADILYKISDREIKKLLNFKLPIIMKLKKKHIIEKSIENKRLVICFSFSKEEKHKPFSTYFQLEEIKDILRVR